MHVELCPSLSVTLCPSDSALVDNAHAPHTAPLVSHKRKGIGRVPRFRRERNSPVRRREESVRATREETGFIRGGLYTGDEVAGVELGNRTLRKHAHVQAYTCRARREQ